MNFVFHNTLLTIFIGIGSIRQNIPSHLSRLNQYVNKKNRRVQTLKTNDVEMVGKKVEDVDKQN